ncbi:MAG TPA: hypothetical protein VK840_05090 [Candidatus Dormibacteraeota bacterium]|nr:hypothetical protein [Candidatus Dormibacteraeota bacterium]
MSVRAKHTQNQSIRVALSPETAGDFQGWVAECLDFDLVAQGKTVEDAKQSFQRTLIGHIGLSIKNGKNPFWSYASETEITTSSQKLPARLKADLRKINIAFSQLERTKTVSVI